jgi:hypothetical protein
MHFWGATGALLAATALTFSACGEQSEADRALGAVRTWHAALTTGDAASACGQLTDNCRRSFELDADPLGLLTCHEVVEMVAEAMTDTERRALRRIKVRKIEVHGDRATIRNKDVDVPPGLQQTAEDGRTILRKVGGRWKLDRLS